MTQTLMTKEATLRISTLGARGDVKKSWNVSVPAEVEDARTSFDALKQKGYTAFRTVKGEKSTRMDTFDATAGEIIMVPQLKGG